MADKFETEYTADEREQTSHLADDQMSLKSKLGGGGRDLGEQSATEQLRLCPACGRVTTFVQGVCSNCDYRPVCRFDWQTNDYRFLKRVSKSEVLTEAGANDG